MNQIKEYPIDIAAPDIGGYREGNTGIDYLHSFDSGVDGPHVMLSAVVHGNELCGAIVLDWLLREKLTPIRGKLSFGFINVAAYANFDPRAPRASRFVDEDFNRLWAGEVLAGDRDSVELRRARDVRPFIDEVDYLLDIHSMQHANVPLMMCGPTEKGRALAAAIGFPAHAICDSGHSAGKRLRDYGDFVDPASPKNALLVECGQHWDSASVNVARETALRFLKHFDVVDRGFIEAHLNGVATPPPQFVSVTGPVTIATENFRFADDFFGMEVIRAAGTVIAWDGDNEVRTPYDDCVLIMPTMRLEKGQSAVRLGRFVS